MSVNVLTQNGLQRIHTVRVQKDSKIRESDVNFYDYDGTLVKSYTKQEFLLLNTMPANPTHEGLTSQGWNWSLADAKAYVTSYGVLDVGQMYITSDGKTRIYVHMEEGRLNPELNLSFAETGSFTVDWGDGTTPDTVSGNANTFGTIAHTYATSGDYIVAVTVNSGKLSIIGANSYTVLFKKTNKTNEENRVYSSCIKEIKLGNGVTSIGNCAFQNCLSLTSITIPSGVTSIGGNAFHSCSSLTSVTIPNEVINIGSSAFYACHSLISISIPSKVTNIESYTFNGCCSLASIIIPSEVTSIGDKALYNCHSLTSITIPSKVTSIGSDAFNICYSLTSVTIPNRVTNIGSGAFSGCYALASITIPSGVTNIESNTFSGCYSLTSVTISSGVTSIGNSAFGSCYSLASITIPSEVISIGYSAFSGSKGLGYIKFTHETPPTVSNPNAFSGVPADCIIYVPTGTLEAYTTAQYYPNPSTYTYIEYTE